jgi:hypothetical protein
MADRLVQTKAWLLMGLIFSGSLVLALVVPTASLWAISQLGRGKTESFYLGLVACPAAVVGWAAVLGRLNGAFRATTGRRDDDVLATCLTIAVIAAFVVFLALMLVVGGHDPSKMGPFPD